MICPSLVGRHPRQPDLFGIIRGIALNGDGDAVSSGSEIDRGAQIVQAVGRGHQTILAPEHGVAVYSTAHTVRAGHALAVDADTSRSAKQLQVDPIRPGSAYRERPGPGGFEVCRKRFTVLSCEIDELIYLSSAILLGAQQARLAIMRPGGDWNRRAGHVVFNGVR